ncbi:MAG: mevalonate kinase [Candidatus Levybacteria bacterium]|nr:mevalonate kinase [Candidatus Levybacteria bacterium]
MKKIKVSAPGKLHLLGEHVVVYGKPAVITAVGKRCFVEITPRKDKKIEIVSNNLKTSKIVSEKEIIAKTQDAQIKWETYIKTNDVALLKSITSDPLDFPIIVIGETLKYLKKSFSAGFKLAITSDIPIGSGMGSSAAVAVSVAGAVYFLFNKNLNKAIINEIAYSAEQKRHGLPSGGDNSASCFGGLVWYRKEAAELKIIQPISFSLSKKLAGNFSVIQTGTPNETTGEMVGMVRALYQKDTVNIDRIFVSQETLTRELLPAIKNENEKELIRIIKEGERNLEMLGVVSDFTKSIIGEIEKLGGAAKICGGGGVKKGTGVLLIYHKNKSQVKAIADSYKLPFLQVSLGVEGLREEDE